MTEVSEHLVSHNNNSLFPWYSFCRDAQSAKHQQRRDIWKQLLTTGKSIYQVTRGQLFYDYLREHSQLARSFDNGMASMSSIEIQDIVQHLSFIESEYLTEIAGGSGKLITEILEKQLHLQGLLFDFDDVVAQVKSFDRLSVKGVNMHKNIPRIRGDAMMKRILHSYSDEQAKVILDNIRNAIQPDNTLYIFELIEDLIKSNPYIGIKNLQMLLVHGAPGESGGPGERTKEEFIGLLNTSGFDLIDTQSLPSIDVIRARLS